MCVFVPWISFVDDFKQIFQILRSSDDDRLRRSDGERRMFRVGLHNSCDERQPIKLTHTHTQTYLLIVFFTEVNCCD